MSETIPALQMAESLYLCAGADALATLEGKLETGEHLMSPEEFQYASDVCRWLRSLVECPYPIGR